MPASSNHPATSQRRGGPLGIYLTTRERDRDALLGYVPLYFAALGQAMVFSPALGRGVLSMIAIIILLVPGFIIFFLNFTNRPPLPPKATFQCWLFASCWSVAFTVVAELFYCLGYLPIMTTHHTSEDYYIPRALHALMYIGLLSFIPLVRYLRFHRGQKT